jgi:hypothetical protein
MDEAGREASVPSGIVQRRSAGQGAYPRLVAAVEDRSLSVRHVKHARGTVTFAAAVALSAALVLGLVAPSPVAAHRVCTHGVSSVGPVYIKSGTVVAGDMIPVTEACLP